MSDFSVSPFKWPLLRARSLKAMKVLEPKYKLGHGLLRARNEVRQQQGGASHDPVPSLPQARPARQAAATATGQAALPPAAACAAAARAGAGPAGLAGLGTSGPGAGAVGNRRRGGTVAPPGPASALG